MDLREERNTTYGSGNITYYFNETVTQTPYKEFSSIISGAAEQVIPLTVLKESTAVIAEYETPVGVPGTTEIIGGLWSFYLHFNAGSAGQNWIIRPAIYKRDSGGTETLVFTSDPVIVTDMNTTTEMYISDGVFPSTTLITTDRLVVRISVQNTRSVSQTISFRTEGSQHYSLASTTLNPVYNPLPILDLQSVTTAGNTTDTNIQFGTGVGVLLNNNSKLKEGTIDAGYGGTKGIAQICAVGYELKWEAGRLYVMGDGGTTIREVSHNFTTIPTAYDDVSKGFITGSRWILDNGDLYTCTDNTTDTATWELNNKIGGTGTTNYVSKFSSTGVIGDSLFQDNGSTTSINGSLDTNFQFIVYNSTRLHAISGINSKVGSADQVGILGTSNGAGTGKNIGVYGSTNSNSILNVGVYGLASGASATNIGGKFSGTGATDNYSVQLEDGTEGIGKVLTSMTADGKAQWAALSTNIPQANKIYVDSINGTDATGRGNINNPYLTPEYALADITNTGTVTATTANLSATLTAVSSTANIVIGQFITGAGIPYGSTVVSKTVNTIVLSKACTAGATITATWWTIYEVILNGNFVVTSNIHKTGFYINSKSLGATISYGNLSLFTFTANILIPLYLSLGKTFGTHANSGLINPAGFTAIEGVLDLGNYYSICTGYNLGNPAGASYLTFTNLTINTEMFDCRFGYISLIAVSGNFTWNGNAYGLLGGLRYTSGYVDINTKITTPASIVAINGTATRGNINGTILGSYTHGGIVNIYANIVGTTATIDGADFIKSVNVYGSLTVTTITLASSPVILDGDITGNVVVNGLASTMGSVVNGSINGTVTVNSGSIKFNGNQEGSYGSRYMTIIIGAGTFINSGLIRLGGLTYTGAGKFVNDGTILTSAGTNTSAPIKITNAGKFVNNKDIIFDNTVDYMPLIEKTSGVLVNNGRMSNPCNMYVRYAANTSASKEVILGYAMSNGNTYGNSTSGTGDINKFGVSLANTDTSLTIFDGTNTVVISVVGAGKSIAVISAEIVTLIKASALLFQNCSYASAYGVVIFIPRAGFTATFTVTTNIGSIGTYVGGGGFVGTVLGGGTELLSSSYNY